MKIRINKQTLAQMPEQVRSLVSEWKAAHRRAFISVENRPAFYPGEDERVTLVNLLTNAQQTAQAAGSFAGYTNLRPGQQITLVAGVVAVCTGFFLGVPYLTIYQASPIQIGGGQ